MSDTAVLTAPGCRFDLLFDPAEEPTVPVAGYCLRRVRALLLLAVAVAQAWLLCGAHRLRQRAARRGSDAGMTTAEYAVGTVAACGFAAQPHTETTSLQSRSPAWAVVTMAPGSDHNSSRQWIEVTDYSARVVA
ncbi:uncharacterized protein DUF4244 [Streptomyces sp. 846.5]|nr:uncharacterized protein DUF4244 [Streptomyces sp. 846.5]